MVHGVVYVTIAGVNQMLMLFVECLGTLQLKQCTNTQPPLVMAQEALYWIMLNVLELKHLYLIVHIMEKEFMIVVLQNGLVSNALQVTK